MEGETEKKNHDTQQQDYAGSGDRNGGRRPAAAYNKNLPVRQKDRGGEEKNIDYYDRKSQYTGIGVKYGDNEHHTGKDGKRSGGNQTGNCKVLSFQKKGLETQK